MARRFPPCRPHAAPRLLLVLAGALAALGGMAPALAQDATDWRYCLGMWEPSRAIYVTMPFPSSASLNEIETAFAAFLDTRGLPHETVLCPRAETEAKALAMRDDAIAYNRIRGLNASLAGWRLGH